MSAPDPGHRRPTALAALLVIFTLALSTAAGCDGDDDDGRPELLAAEGALNGEPFEWVTLLFYRDICDTYSVQLSFGEPGTGFLRRIFNVTWGGGLALGPRVIIEGFPQYPDNETGALNCSAPLGDTATAFLSTWTSDGDLGTATYYGIEHPGFVNRFAIDSAAADGTYVAGTFSVAVGQATGGPFPRPDGLPDTVLFEDVVFEANLMPPE